MAKLYWFVYFMAVFIAAVLVASPAGAFTDPLDVIALQELYKTLNEPPQLMGWGLDGDPCSIFEAWDGVICVGANVQWMLLHDRNLTGYISPEIKHLYRLQKLDISSNTIAGEIPNVLPPNVTHLNLSHNLLSGPIGNVFPGLQNLREMDLSYNNFTGALPSSFGSLTNLTGLYLQNNQLTGSVACLSELPLIALNIENNGFTGIIPRHFQSIPNLWIGGNSFHLQGDNTGLNKSGIQPPPATQSSAMEERSPSTKLGGHKKRRLGPGGIAFVIGGGTLVASCLALYIAVRIKQSRAQKLITLWGGAIHSFSVINTAKDSPMNAREESQAILTFRPPILPPVYHSTVEKTGRKSFSDKCSSLLRIKRYTVADLQSATNSFAQEKLLGQGSLSSVYKAEFPDGQILAVKNIKMSGLSFHEEEQFLDVISSLSQLKHSNIVPLVGYCVERGQHLLVYEYVGNLSLDEALHSDAYKPLSWDLRLQIALAVAQALNYLHSTLSPPVAHGNLKSDNILLDEELAPHICDCGLAILRPLTSNSLQLKASENAVGDTGYIALHVLPGFDKTKNDIRDFGVLLSELLTGRKPSYSSRPREEQSLVKLASLGLDETETENLVEMIDPGIKKTCSSKALSDFADIISRCTQPVKEFRPAMSEVVSSLTQLIQKKKRSKQKVPVKILGKTKRILRNRMASVIEVLWNHDGMERVTLESETEMMKKYPHLA